MQHDQVLNSNPGRDIRLDINAAVQALASTNSGPSEPATTVGGQLWFDDASPDRPRLFLRNAGNNGWLNMATDLSPSKYVGVSANRSATKQDKESFFQFFNAGTLLLPKALGLGTQWYVTVSAFGGAVTVQTQGADEVNDAASIVIPRGSTLQVWSMGNDQEFRTSTLQTSPATIAKVIDSVPVVTQLLTTDKILVLRADNTLALVGKDALGNPPGTIVPTAFTAVPENHLACNGAAVSRTTYARLFQAIGTFWGTGDGSSTFNLPDLRGVFLRGFDAGRGLDPSRVFGSYQDSSVASHAHNYSDPAHAHQCGEGQPNPQGTNTQGTGSGGSTSQGTVNNSSQSLASYGNYISITIAYAGGAESRPRNLAITYAIRY